MKKFLIYFLLSLVLIHKPVLAQEPAYDPMQRNLIFVEGEAEMSVPINGFQLTFGFDIEKSSFDEASKISEDIAAKLGAAAQGLGLTNVEVIKGWDLVKQSRISLSSKGHKISNRLVLKVRDFPEGKLHALIGQLIDKSLSVSDAIGLERIDVFVSEDIENKKREELATQALKTLQSNAARTAEALGRKLTDPKRVFITNDQNLQQEVVQDYGRPLYQEILLSKSVVSIQKSFKVSAEVVDHMKFNARVSGIYQIE